MVQSSLSNQLRQSPVDVDAVANWLNTSNGSAQNPTNISRGRLESSSLRLSVPSSQHGVQVFVSDHTDTQISVQAYMVPPWAWIAS